jgi:hypothetical protein
VLSLLRQALREDPSILREALAGLEAATSANGRTPSAPRSPARRKRCSATPPTR